METLPASSLQFPSFLQGPLLTVERKALQEGRRCAEQYRKNGSFHLLHDMREVGPGEGVSTHEKAGLLGEQPTWRLYMVSRVLTGLCEALDWQNAFQVSDAYEAFCRETPWGALYFVTSGEAPRSAERTALRLQAVLRFWESLQSASYLYKTSHRLLTLDELMSAACHWAMDAWGPGEEAAVRMRLQVAAERMVRATKQDCVEAILRQLPRVLPLARGLKHQDTLAEPGFWRERLATLDPKRFELLSGACPPELLGQMHDWDRQLGG